MITRKQHDEAKSIIDQYRVESFERATKYNISIDRKQEILDTLDLYVPFMKIETDYILPLCMAIEELCENYSKDVKNT